MQVHSPKGTMVPNENDFIDKKYKEYKRMKLHTNWTHIPKWAFGKGGKGDKNWAGAYLATGQKHKNTHIDTVVHQL